MKPITMWRHDGLHTVGEFRRRTVVALVTAGAWISSDELKRMAADFVDGCQRSSEAYGPL